MVWKNLLAKSMSPHLACYGYTMYGSQYNTIPFMLGKLFAQSTALKPLRDLYFSAFDYRFASYGCRFDDKNLHTDIFFKAIAKHSPHAQKMLIRRANRAFDLMTKKEKAPYNVAAEEKPHHRWMAASVAEATYEQQEFEQYEAIAQAEMKAHRL